MKFVFCLAAAFLAAVPALAQDVLVRRETTVTGRAFVQDRLGSRYVICTPAVYKRLERGHWRHYRRAVDCPDPTNLGLNTTNFLLPLGVPRYRDARFAGYTRHGWIRLR